MRLQRPLQPFAVGIAVLGIACSSDGTSPPAVTSVTLGPSTAASFQTVGRTLQLVPTVTFADGGNDPSVVITWSTSASAVATVSSTGLVTAAGNGTTEIRATARGVQSAPYVVTVAQYGAGAKVTGAAGAIAGLGLNRQYTAGLVDSLGTAVAGGSAPAWLSRNTGVFTVSPASGSSTTVTTVSVGAAYLVATIDAFADSIQVTVTNPPPPPPSVIGVTVTDNAFTSARNATSNEAIDTVAVGGTVTWTFAGTSQHNVTSNGNPSFTSGPNQSNGTLARTFNASGTYTYICGLHAGMGGRIIVR